MRMQLSDQAKRIVLELARLEAVRVKANWVLPDHIAMAILRHPEAPLDNIFSGLNLKTPGVCALLEELIQRGSSNNHHPSLADETKLLIEQASIEAHATGSAFVEVEHIFLTLFIDRKGVLFQCLNKFAVNPDEFKLLLNNKRPSKKSPNTNFSHNHAHHSAHQSGVFTSPITPTDMLAVYCQDITAKARNNKIDPVVGREEELNKMMRILNRKSKNNPVLIGEAGVGKTAIVEALALRIVAKQVPISFLNKTIFMLDITALIGGTRYRGEFEKRISTLLNELSEMEQAILFIDEIHLIAGAGAAEGSMDVANILKPVLARGKLCCIGATTLKEYRESIEKDSALERRFQTIIVSAPNRVETIGMLHGLRASYESIHQVHYKDEALQVAVDLSIRYLPHRQLPDKAIDLMDEAGAQKSLSRFEMLTQMAKFERQGQLLFSNISRCIQHNHKQQAKQLQNELKDLQNQLDQHYKVWHSTQQDTITRQDIQMLISELTGLSSALLEGDYLSEISLINRHLKSTIIGQDKAIDRISQALLKGFSPANKGTKPLASLLLVGDSGVGKSFLAKELAKNLFRNKNALVRIDLSEYSDRMNLSRLIGSSAGYAGHAEGGVLTDPIRRQGYCVLLLDEIDKAHPDILNLLIPLLEEAALVDNWGRMVSFSNTVVIMTTSKGSATLGQTSVGFGHHQQVYKNNLQTQLKSFFSIEFLSRIDEIVPFLPLEKNHFKHIVELHLQQICQQIWYDWSVSLCVCDSVALAIVNQLEGLNQGVRSIQQIISQSFEEPLICWLLQHRYQADNVSISWDNEQLVMKIDEMPLSKTTQSMLK
jgi:ATP-dependent Clp protease ATP-binding subunit ClpC